MNFGCLGLHVNSYDLVHIYVMHTNIKCFLTLIYKLLIELKSQINMNHFSAIFSRPLHSLFHAFSLKSLPTAYKSIKPFPLVVPGYSDISKTKLSLMCFRIHEMALRAPLICVHGDSLAERI